MIIRQEQMETLEAASLQEFENRTYSHLLKWFPHHCELIGDKQVRAGIRHGLSKSTSHELKAERCVRSYIEFMFMLGGGFDADVLLPWAAEILNDRKADETTRADQLYYKVWDYVKHVSRDYRDESGQPDTARFMPELKQLRHGNDTVVGGAEMPEFLESLERQIQMLFPAKCSYSGAENVRQAIADGVESARGYDITADRGTRLFVFMRFVLGAGFHRDPLLPWASAALEDPSTPDQFKRADKLYSEAVTTLNRWWEISSIPPAAPKA